MTNTLTIAGWIRPRGDGYMIFWRGDHRPGLDPYMLAMNGNHDLRFQICNEDGKITSVDADIPYGQWLHVAATLDRDTGYSRLRIYTNSVLAAQAMTDIQPFGQLQSDASPGIGIGNLNDGGNTFPFLGDIDEIALYNRALSAKEIEMTYAMEKGGSQPSTSNTGQLIGGKNSQSASSSAADKNSALPVDLTDYYTTSASGFDQITDFPAWKSVPRGTQLFDQVPFEIGGMFCLWGQGCAQRRPPVIFPEAVTGIRLNRKFETLYVYHGSFYSSPAGTPVCDVVFHYEDGSTVTNRMLYGDDFLDWTVNYRGGTAIKPTDSNSKLAWVGGSYFVDKIQPLTFCLTAIKNPRPQMPVVSVDFYSLKSRTAAVIMALTTGQPGLMQEKNVSGNEPADLREAHAKLAELRADYADSNPVIQRMLARIKELERITKEEPDAPADLREAKARLAELRVDFAEQNPLVQEALARIKALEQNGYGPKYVAMIAVRSWLTLADAGDYSQTWDTAADSFRADGQKDAWVKLLEKVRTPLGSVISRQLISTHSSSALPGMPDGSYFIAQFETAFAGLPGAVETVTFGLEQDGQWKAIAYLIRPRTAEQTAAIAAAQKWLAGIDDRNYAQSWTDAAEFFQGALMQDKWVVDLESARKPLGELKIRTVDSAVTETQMPGAPDGKYVVMQFETAFAKNNSATETVTFVLEKDGQWKADGYYIK